VVTSPWRGKAHDRGRLADHRCDGRRLSEVCSLGSCELTSPPNLSDCEGSCRDSSVGRANCGACGVVCEAGEVCSVGVCEVSCGGGSTGCTEAVWTRTATRRTAAPARRPAGRACVAGVCEPPGCDARDLRLAAVSTGNPDYWARAVRRSSDGVGSRHFGLGALRPAAAHGIESGEREV